MSICLKGVCKRLGNFELRINGLYVDEGEYLAVMGPSGCGKSTLLRLIAGVHRPDCGKIFIRGIDVTEMPPEKRRVGYVPQGYCLFPHMTVFENIAYGLKARGFKRNEIESRVLEAAKALGITGLLDKRPKELSGGEMQRVAIARALAFSPDVLLLDEPFSMLDYLTKAEAMNFVRNVVRKFGITVIHVTHDLMEAIELADKIAVMDNGRIVSIEASDEVLRRPRDEFTAKFLGLNIIEAYAYESDNGTTILDLGFMKVEVDKKVRGRVKAAIRPDCIRPDNNGVEGIVVGRSSDAFGLVYLVSIGDRTIRVRAWNHDVRIGSKVRLTIDPRCIAIFDQ